MTTEHAFRAVFLLVVLCTAAISTYYRSVARSVGGTIARRDEGAMAVVLRLVLTVPLAGSVLLYALVDGAMSWSALPLPVWARQLGCVLGLLCALGEWWVLRSIGPNISETVLTKHDHKLVTSGPYRWVRHPLYSLGLAGIFSLGLIASNWFMLRSFARGSRRVPSARHPEGRGESRRRVRCGIRAVPAADIGAGSAIQLRGAGGTRGPGTAGVPPALSPLQNEYWTPPTPETPGVRKPASK